MEETLTPAASNRVAGPDARLDDTVGSAISVARTVTRNVKRLAERGWCCGGPPRAWRSPGGGPGG